MDRYWFMSNNYYYNVPRGPFASSREWLDSYIRIIMEDVKSGFLSCQDEHYMTELEVQFKIAERLLGLLPTLFPVADLPEPTVVYHQNHLG